MKMYCIVKGNVSVKGPKTFGRYEKSVLVKSLMCFDQRVMERLMSSCPDLTVIRRLLLQSEQIKST